MPGNERKRSSPALVDMQNIMRKITGVTLMAASLYIFLTEAWYLNFEMEAWSRGMNRTPTYQRIIATLIFGILTGFFANLGWKLIKKKELTIKEKNQRLRERYPSPFERESTR